MLLFLLNQLFKEFGTMEKPPVTRNTRIEVL